MKRANGTSKRRGLWLRVNHAQARWENLNRRGVRVGLRLKAAKAVLSAILAVRCPVEDEEKLRLATVGEWEKTIAKLAREGKLKNETLPKAKARAIAARRAKVEVLREAGETIRLAQPSAALPEAEVR